ncbi:MAG: DNA cytosine methyltransferase [Oscillospiraceae bacterium]
MEKQNSLTLGSLFDGSGGFPLGGLISGITPLWSSEIEPFPIRVTTKRIPQMKHYGDITKINGGEIEPVDIITFGSPCQDMSVAGKRNGLGGSRSSLFYEAVRVIKEMRCRTNGKYPRFIVWENVPGAFSSNKGEDFRVVLEEICKIKDECVHVPKPAKWQTAGKILGDDYSVAWRQFDAQFWGVPQRRKRIYLVADLAGWSAGKILFESEGLSGYSAQSFRSWKETANRTAESIGETSCDSLMFENHGQDTRFVGPLDVAQTVSSTYGTGGNNQPFVVHTPKTLKIRSGCDGGGKGALIQNNKSATLGCNNDQTVFVPKVYGICSKNSNSMRSSNPNSGFYEAETSRCLDANGGDPSCNQGGMAVIEGNGTRPSHNGDGFKESEVMYTLNATEQHGVAYGIGRPAMNQGINAQFSFQIEEEVEPTIVAAGASGVAHPVYSSSKASFFTTAEEELANTLVATDYKDPPIIGDETQEDYIVRRLTPTECARLQGFPDWWCDDLGTEEPTEEDISFWRDVFDTHAKALGKNVKPKTDNQIRKWLKSPHSDSAEYKMWGNGVALPNVVFVLSGIVYYSQQKQDYFYI